MIKNISNVGAILSKESQQKIMGGVLGSIVCSRECFGTCSDPNHTCVSSPCRVGNRYTIMTRCECTNGGDY